MRESYIQSRIGNASEEIVRSIAPLTNRDAIDVALLSFGYPLAGLSINNSLVTLETPRHDWHFEGILVTRS